MAVMGGSSSFSSGVPEKGARFKQSFRVTLFRYKSRLRNNSPPNTSVGVKQWVPRREDSADQAYTI